MLYHMIITGKLDYNRILSSCLCRKHDEFFLYCSEKLPRKMETLQKLSIAASDATRKDLESTLVKLEGNYLYNQYQQI